MTIRHHFVSAKPDGQDTSLLRPSDWNAVHDDTQSVTYYGAVGDGVTDDTSAIQDAATATAGMTLVIPQGTFLVSNTISVGSGTLVLGLGGTLKLSDTPDAGGFDETCRVFDCQNAAAVRFEGVGFAQPDSDAAYSALAFGAAAVRLHDSTACEVRSCRFEFDGFATAQTNYMNAVWVEGTSAADNRSESNYCEGAAIEYAYNGPVRTSVRGNSVISSPYNGISGHCGSNAGTDNIVEANYIVDPARMGIEDWGEFMSRTTIRGNVISNTGVSLTNGFGISVVATGGVIDDNILTDFEGYGIEAAGDDQKISGNVLRQVAGGHVDTGEGIMVNSYTDSSSHLVSGNSITGCSTAIHLYQWGDCTVSDNAIVDPKSKGITCQPNASLTLSTLILGNPLRVTAGCSVERHLLECLAQGGAGGVVYTIEGNSFIYDAAADSGTNYELAAVLTASGIGFIGNTIDGGGISYTGVTPIVTANGTTPDKVRLIGNRCLGGATIVQTGMTNQVDLGNTT